MQHQPWTISHIPRLKMSIISKDDDFSGVEKHAKNLQVKTTSASTSDMRLSSKQYLIIINVDLS